MAPLPNNLAATTHTLTKRLAGIEQSTLIGLAVGVGLFAIAFVIGMVFFIYCWCKPSRSRGHQTDWADDDSNLMSRQTLASRHSSNGSLEKPTETAFPVMGQVGNPGHHRSDSDEPLVNHHNNRRQWPLAVPDPVAERARPSRKQSLKNAVSGRIRKARQ